MRKNRIVWLVARGLADEHSGTVGYFSWDRLTTSEQNAWYDKAKEEFYKPLFKGPE